MADDETYTEDVKGGFWTFKYPVNDEPASRRVHPLLHHAARDDARRHRRGVHPDDERYKHLIGKTVTIPLVNREIPIIADGLLADPTLGTGCVKVTPAHDPNDYACWPAHTSSPMINILNPDGTINENGGKYAGLDRYKARDAVVEDMEELGLFEGKEDREIPLKYSDRSKTPIEPYLSDQWFVKMGDRDDGKPGLAQMAMDAVTDGRVKFFPERYAKTLPRLARRETRLVHQPATLVGAPHSGLVRTDVRRADAKLQDAHSHGSRPDVDSWRAAIEDDAGQWHDDALHAVRLPSR